MKFNKSMDWLKESNEDLLADDELDMVDEGLYVDPANYGKHNDLIDVVDKAGNPQKMTQATYDKNKDSGEFTVKEPEEKEEENFKTVEDIAGIKEDELNEWLEDNIDFSVDSEFNAEQIAEKIPALKSHEKELADAIDKYSDDYTVEMPFTYAIQTTLSKIRNGKTSEPEKKEVKAGKKAAVQDLKQDKAYVAKEDIFYGNVEDIADDEEYIQSLKDKGLVNDKNEVVIPAGTNITFKGNAGGAYVFDVNGEELDMSMDDVDLYEADAPALSKEEKDFIEKTKKEMPYAKIVKHPKHGVLAYTPDDGTLEDVNGKFYDIDDFEEDELDLVKNEGVMSNDELAKIRKELSDTSKATKLYLATINYNNTYAFQTTAARDKYLKNNVSYKDNVNERMIYVNKTMQELQSDFNKENWVIIAQIDDYPLWHLFDYTREAQAWTNEIPKRKSAILQVTLKK